MIITVIKNFNQFKQVVNEAGVIAPLSSTTGNQFFRALDGDVTLGDRLPKELIDDLEASGKEAGVRVLATTAESDHRGIHDSFSRHNKGQALDLAKIGWASTDWSSLPGSGGGTQGNYKSKQEGNDGPKSKEFFDAADALVAALINRGYKIITQDDEIQDKYPNSITSGESGPKAIIWKYTSSRAGNHYNHIHISNTSADGAAADETPSDGTTVTAGGASMATIPTIIDSDLITRIITKLKEKNFSQEDLKKFSKKTGSDGSSSIPALSSAEDEDFYKAVLTGIGANSTPEKIKFLKAWRQAEGGKANYNPFNTTKSAPGTTDYNSVGVKEYPDRQTGLEATIKTLKLSYYTDLVSKLMDDSSTAEEIASSPDLETWGTGSGVERVLRGGSINPPPIAVA
jgi:hypothetical protein